MRLHRCLLLAALVLATAVPAGPPTGAGNLDAAEVERLAQKWNALARDKWQKPPIVFDLLAIEEGDVVAEIGAGTGYFAGRLAILVGETGKVFAVDVEQAMLDYILANQPVGRERIVPVLAEPDDPGLPAGEADVILIVNTWHHVENRKAYLAHLARALKPGGRLMLVDFYKKELPVGPPPAEKLRREDVLQEFRDTGWSLAAETLGLPYQYALVFRPPAAN